MESSTLKQFTPTDNQVLTAIALLKRKDSNFGMKRITESLKIEYPRWIIGKGRVQLLLRRKNVIQKFIDDKNLSLDCLTEVPYIAEDTKIDINELGGEEIQEEGNETGNDNGEETEEFLQWSRKFHNNCKEYLDWVSRDYSLKVQSNPVPQAVLQGTNIQSIVIHDVRVPSRQGFRKDKNTKKKIQVTEDVIFNENEKIRKNVARGNTLLTIKYKNKQYLSFPLQANKKFTGGSFDDDDQDNVEGDVWKKFFIEDIDNTSTIVQTRKENGSAAHLSVFKLDNQYFYIAGSKNVHIICKDKKDVEHYNNDERVTVAKIVANTVFDMFQQNPSSQSTISEYLSSNHLTACFELLDPNDQHIEDFSHLTRPTLKFITFTQASQVASSPQPTLCINPLLSLAKAKEIGLNPISFSEHPYSAFEDLCKNVRKEHGHEGVVLYFVNKSGNVIGLLKKKTSWYIFIRAIREKIKNYPAQINKHPESLVDICKKVNLEMGTKLKTRFKDIKRWLDLDESYIQKWLDLGLGFSTWVSHNLINKKLDVKDIGSKFPAVWNKYLAEGKKSDKF